MKTQSKPLSQRRKKIRLKATVSSALFAKTLSEVGASAGVGLSLSLCLTTVLKPAKYITAHEKYSEETASGRSI